MRFLRNLFAGKAKPRIRICVECGMPIAEHKAWCSILQGQIERDLAKSAGRPAAEGEG
jgi:hypothetical protein